MKPIPAEVWFTLGYMIGQIQVVVIILFAYRHRKEPAVRNNGNHD